MIWIVTECLEDTIQYVSSDGSYVAQFIYPHSGTDYKFIVRINRLYTFDRWGNSEIEEWLDNEVEAFKLLNTFKGL